MKKLLLWLVTTVISVSLQAQNLGVNQSDPSQPLEVGGVIFTNEGGVMFPDSTLQTTAASLFLFVEYDKKFPARTDDVQAR